MASPLSTTRAIVGVVFGSERTSFVAGVEVDRHSRGRDEPLDVARERAQQRRELLVRRQLCAEAMQVEEAPRQRGRALVQIGALDRDRRFVADRGEKLEITLVVGVRLRALDRDRSDGLSLKAEGRDDQRALTERAPWIALRQAETSAILVGVT
jgi:hypothetical protein